MAHERCGLSSRGDFLDPQPVRLKLRSHRVRRAALRCRGVPRVMLSRFRHNVPQYVARRSDAADAVRCVEAFYGISRYVAAKTTQHAVRRRATPYAA